MHEVTIKFYCTFTAFKGCDLPLPPLLPTARLQIIYMSCAVQNTDRTTIKCIMTWVWAGIIIIATSRLSDNEIQQIPAFLKHIMETEVLDHCFE